MTLITLHLCFMTCIMAFTFFSMVVFHSYKKFEIPRVEMSHRLTRAAFDARAGNLTGLGYCGGTGNDLVDYVTPSGARYNDPTCVTVMQPSEFTSKDPKSMWINTHLRQRTLTRSCTGATSTNFGTSCVETVNTTVDAYIANVESLGLEFRPYVQTSWGWDEPPDRLIIEYPSGHSTTVYPKQTGQHTLLTVAQLLELASVDLDESSTEAEGTAAVFQAKRAPHRLMGLNLKVRLTCTNLNPWRPFEEVLEAKLSVMKSVVTQRNGPPTQNIYLGGASSGTSTAAGTPHVHDGTRVERSWSGIYVEFEGAGNVGITDPFTTIIAVTNAFVLIGMATFAVDIVGQLISSRFYDDKFEDDGERAVLEGIAAHLQNPAHRDVPFDPKDLRLVNDYDEPGMSYENAIYNLMTQVREVEDRLSMIPEEEAEFVEGSAPGRPADGVPKLMLVEEMSEMVKIRLKEAGEEIISAEVPLHQGIQMMGRGVGNVISKAVSRQQFTLTVVKDKVRMKALRDGPGYMREETQRFEPLKAGKAVVLKAGDRVVFRMRTGKQGGHLGIYRIDAIDEESKGFFSVLLGC